MARPLAPAQGVDLDLEPAVAGMAPGHDVQAVEELAVGDHDGRRRARPSSSRPLTTTRSARAAASSSPDPPRRGAEHDPVDREPARVHPERVDGRRDPGRRRPSPRSRAPGRGPSPAAARKRTSAPWCASSTRARSASSPPTSRSTGPENGSPQASPGLITVNHPSPFVAKVGPRRTANATDGDGRGRVRSWAEEAGGGDDAAEAGAGRAAGPVGGLLGSGRRRRSGAAGRSPASRGARSHRR